MCAHKTLGIAVVNADLKLEGSKENETKVLMGEPVEILRVCKGGRGFLVRTRNYEGVVPARSIGKCTREIQEKYCESGRFVIAKEYFWYHGGLIRMGSRFPLVEVGAEEMECLMPCSVFGMFYVKRQQMPSIYLQEGYLKYSRENVLALARSVIGMKYGWGDEGDGIDCSSFVGGIFRCMGIFLPRNVKNMLEMDMPCADVRGLPFEEITEKLVQFKEGCLLLTEHHVMIFAGIKEKIPYFIHCSSRMGGYCMESDIGPYAGEAVKIMAVGKDE